MVGRARRDSIEQHQHPWQRSGQCQCRCPYSGHSPHLTAFSTKPLLALDVSRPTSRMCILQTILRPHVRPAVPRSSTMRRSSSTFVEETTDAGQARSRGLPRNLGLRVSNVVTPQNQRQTEGEAPQKEEAVIGPGPNKVILPSIHLHVWPPGGKGPVLFVQRSSPPQNINPVASCYY